MHRTITRICVGTAAAVMLFAALLLAVAFAPTLAGYESLVVSSGSMGKAAPVGSVVQTRMVDVFAIAPGDVISFRHAGSSTVVTHRVVDIEESGGRIRFRTKGDANPTADPQPVVFERGRTVARVEHVVPIAGWIVRLARTPLGALVLLALPLGALYAERARPSRRAAPKPARRPTVPVPAAAVARTQVTGRIRHRAVPSRGRAERRSPRIATALRHAVPERVGAHGTAIAHAVQATIAHALPGAVPDARAPHEVDAPRDDPRSEAPSWARLAVVAQYPPPRPEPAAASRELRRLG